MDSAAFKAPGSRCQGSGFEPSPLARPVSPGRLIARALSTWVRRASRCAILTFGFGVPLGVLAAAWTGGSAPGVALAPIVLTVLTGLTGVVLVIGYTRGALHHLSGHPVRVGAMVRAGFTRLVPVLGLVPLAGVPYLALASVGAVVELADRSGSGAVVHVLVLVAGGALAVVGLALVAGVAVTIPVMVAERAGPIVGLRRSWSLTRGRRIAVVLAALGLGLLLVAVLFAVIGLMVKFARPHNQWMLGLLLIAICALVAPLLAIAPAVAYHDLRIEKEGAPTEELAEVFD